MSDTITRWECPKCGRDAALGHITFDCPGVPVERTYVAVDYVESAIAFLRWPDLDWAERCARAENELLAAINAVTGEA